MENIRNDERRKRECLIFLPHAHELVRMTFEVQLTAILKHIADAVKKYSLSNTRVIILQLVVTRNVINKLPGLRDSSPVLTIDDPVILMILKDRGYEIKVINTESGKALDISGWRK